MPRRAGFGPGNGGALAVGGVLSIFTLLIVALAELPALSTTVKVRDLPPASALKVKLPEAGESSPDRLSPAM